MALSSKTVLQLRKYEPFRPPLPALPPSCFMLYTTKPPGLGTGLGLTIVRRIIDQSGGHIRVNSVLEAGTSFTIYWPRLGAAH